MTLEQVHKQQLKELGFTDKQIEIAELVMSINGLDWKALQREAIITYILVELSNSGNRRLNEREQVFRAELGESTE